MVSTLGVPLSVAALRARLSRERLLRRVQEGAVRGEMVDGRWLVDPTSLERFIALQGKVKDSR